MRTKLILLICFLSVTGCDTSKKDREPTDSGPSFSLSGTFTSAIGAATDTDSNDPEASFETNDTPATAQSLLNPALLGGFVTRAGVGNGRFSDSADSSDVFLATLAKGQAVTLFISDHDTATPYDIDLDLELYNTSGIAPDIQPVAVSISATAGTEMIRIQENGTYHIIVRSVRGASNYLLSIGQPASLPSAALHLENEFVPGEIVVRFKNSIAAESATPTSQVFAASTGLVKKRGTTGQAMLFSLGDDVQRKQTLQILGINQKAAGDRSPEADLQLKEETIATIRALRKRADIESVDLNYIRHVAAIPNDDYYPLQWSYPLINLPQAWDVTTQPGTGGDMVIVAVVDTGVFLSHPDLQANLLATGYDLIANPSIAADGDGIDDNPDDPGDSSTPGGSSFHGTHVTGIIAAQADNSTGVTGVAWGTNTKIMPIRVLGLGGGTTYDIIQGIRYAAGLSNDSGTVPPQRADIINLSLGGPGFSMTEQAEYNAVRNAGVIIIAAAGNDNSDIPSYPAAYDSVISVSAVTIEQQKAPYSNFGPSVDVAAPGGNTSIDSDGDGNSDGILSTLVDGSRNPIYSFAQGTSMASPHVAGITAIMKSLDPELNPDKFTALLQAGKLTSDLGAPGRDDLYGFGLIDAFKAVENIDITLPPIIAIDHTGALNFGSFINQLMFSTRNAGGGELTIARVSDDADWLETDPQTLDGSEGTFAVTVNRTGLVDGIYRATITIEADPASSLTIPVTLQVGQRQERGDTGHHYIILLNPDNMEPVHMVHAANHNGSYQYQFSNIPAGEYFIVAGTDLDNDGLICDPGEACGGYPTIERLQPVKVYSNTGDIDFGTNFNIIIRASSEGSGRAGMHGFLRIPNE